MANYVCMYTEKKITKDEMFTLAYKKFQLLNKLIKKRTKNVE